MTELAEIIAGLTAAQRDALVEAPSTPHGNSWLVCRGSTKTALVGKRLASGHGDWCTLTHLGKEVRDALAVAESDAPKGGSS